MSSNDISNAKFPLKILLKFIFRKLLCIFLILIICGVIPFFIKNLQSIKEIKIYEILVCLLLFPITFTIDMSIFESINLESEGIYKRKAWINILISLLIISIMLIIFGIWGFTFDNFPDNYSEWLFITENAAIFTSGLYLSSSIGYELSDTNFYSCKYCNLLNVMQFDEIKSKSEVKEHTHYEKGYYEDDVSKVKSKVEVDGRYHDIETEIVNKVYVPGKTVSDGMFKHTYTTRYFKCPYCGNKKTNWSETSEKI